MAITKPSPVAMFAAAETTRAVPTMGATATRMSSNVIEGDAGVGRRFDVERIGRSGCVHRDQGGDPGDHEFARARSLPSSDAAVITASVSMTGVPLSGMRIPFRTGAASGGPAGRLAVRRSRG